MGVDCSSTVIRKKYRHGEGRWVSGRVRTCGSFCFLSDLESGSSTENKD